MQYTIAVFGSSSASEGDVEYQLAQAIGACLAEAGCVVITGGYGGIMEAASRGAAEQGGSVVGVTTEKFHSMRPEGANSWVGKEIRYPGLKERLMHLCSHVDGYIVMPGGVGTLAEIVVVWEFMRAGEIPRRPLVCVGEYWQQMFASLQSSSWVTADSWDYLTFQAADAKQVVQSVLAAIE